MKPSARIVAAIGLFVWAGPAFAHHSYAMYDRQKTDTVTGTVKSFEMVNPHGWLTVVARDGQGKTREWAFETGGVGQMTRAGWTAAAVSAGEKITVTIHPMRDGSNSGQLVSAVLASGQTLRGFPGV